MVIYDSHMHTTNSDGQNTLIQMCDYAAANGIQGITITNHADMNFYESRDTYNRIKGDIREIRQAQRDYAGRLEVMCGVELGEYLYAPENAKQILELTEYDCILNSVHLVPAARWDKPYNRIVFSEDGTDEELQNYLKLYFDLLSDTVDAFDFDVLAHIACPVRYMTGKYGRTTNALEFEPKIREILQKIIDRNIALEWNSAGFQQNEEIFAIYYQMGGRLITLGSDAHSCGGIAGHFEEVKAVLKQCGFTHYHYFKNRRPQQVEL